MPSFWETLLLKRELLIADAAQMHQLGRELGAILPAGAVLWLRGELGAGKTTLTQGIARGLEIEDSVASPTFVLMTEYPDGRAPLLHLDAYRLENLSNDDLREVGLDDFFTRTDAVRIIEWPQCIGKYLQGCAPPQYIIDIEHENDARHVYLADTQRLQVLADAF